ncbi:MAG: RNA polymerase subunit sigma [Clostridium sp.]
MSNVDFKRVEAILYNYPVIKAEIKNMKLDLEILENDYKGVNALSYEEKSGPTHKISSSVEDEVLRRADDIQKLRSKIRLKEIQVEKINNALESLDSKERFILEERYFKKTFNKSIAAKLEVTEDTASRYKNALILKLITLI